MASHRDGRSRTLEHCQGIFFGHPKCEPCPVEAYMILPSGRAGCEERSASVVTQQLIEKYLYCTSIPHKGDCVCYPRPTFGREPSAGHIEFLTLLWLKSCVLRVSKIKQEIRSKKWPSVTLAGSCRVGVCLIPDCLKGVAAMSNPSKTGP